MTGLAGHSAAYTELVWLVATLLGGAILVALLVIYRRARARRELEEADAIIAAAYAEDTRDRRG